MKLPIFKLNHKHHSSAFFFNALYSAVIFAVVLVVNDLIDEYIDKNKFKNHHHKYIKLLIHFTTNGNVIFSNLCISNCLCDFRLEVKDPKCVQPPTFPTILQE